MKINKTLLSLLIAGAIGCSGSKETKLEELPTLTHFNRENNIEMRFYDRDSNGTVDRYQEMKYNDYGTGVDSKIITDLERDLMNQGIKEFVDSLYKSLTN